jgi:hypothetical protein
LFAEFEGKRSAGASGVLPVVVKLRREEYGPYPIEFFARTLQKYLDWKDSVPVTRVVSASVESLIMKELKSESDPIWR